MSEKIDEKDLNEVTEKDLKALLEAEAQDGDFDEELFQPKIQTNVRFIYEDEKFTLIGDDGEEVDVMLIATVELDNKTFVLAQPLDEKHETADDEAVIFEAEPQDEKTSLFKPVLDDELGDRVFEEYLKATAEMD